MKTNALKFFIALGLVGSVLAGCGDKDSGEQEPPKGKVDIKEMPAGSVAPGETRPGKTEEGRDGG